MAVNLEDLYRHERARDDRRQPLRPSLRMPEPNTFGDKEGSVDEAADAEILEFLGRNIGSFAKGEVDQMPPRIESKLCDQESHRIRWITSMKQVQGAKAHRDKGDRFE